MFYQYVCSLGIEPTTFCAANAMLYHWATGTLRKSKKISQFQNLDPLYTQTIALSIHLRLYLIYIKFVSLIFSQCLPQPILQILPQVFPQTLLWYISGLIWLYLKFILSIYFDWYLRFYLKVFLRHYLSLFVA